MSSEELGQWAGDCSAPRPAPLVTGLAITVCTRTPHDTQLRYTHINNKHRAAAGPETKGTERDKENQAFLSIGQGGPFPKASNFLSYKIL